MDIVNAANWQATADSLTAAESPSHTDVLMAGVLSECARQLLAAVGDEA